ncbi:hypothetical protein SNOG_06799 [Parastagonospora nodorum SN15]|uniref:DNA replication regulator Sld3 C-terminal domain-containing protein n=1 Tax=Phaeosphaeria nodorum (strain SN15 / ATCC MYA-4574 / FGSC 10173) TaxID=321614 RepID=Q0UN65_PHANO|nr:hypothetical protein SNOG_06799 [Parastagonospora nodorum SN15]EAT85450.2 hypothetical protein SNOG_06799 [Parastagonospora nodorum SN15]
MLHSVSSNPIKLLGVTTKRDEAKPQLPSKRKRDAICGLGTFTKPFEIKPYTGSSSDKPASFKPVRIIGRSQLPLTFLDTTADESFAANSLFSAHIDVLESEYGSEKDAPKVLIARYDTKRTLYAIERVQTRVYSICRLASWLKEKDVSELWDPSGLQSYPVLPRPEQSTPNTGEWWQHAAAEAPSAERPVKRARMTMMRKTQAPQPEKEKISQRFDSPADHEHILSDSIPADVPEVQFAAPSPQEQLESIVQQYLDAIYMSKTSLAYFSKGPIARIRTAFTSPDEGAPPTHELVTFLRSMLLTPKASEKKYYEKLPAVIRALPPGSFSDDEPTVAASKPKKTKKKLKLSREGVYPHEEAMIKKWWHSNMPTGEETIDQRIKRRIGELRVRETLAQLTLMLEVIALEALSTYKPPPEDDLPVDETQALEDSQAKPKKRKRKLDDIGLQLDLLLDRLCIWHATEEAGILDFDAKITQQYDDAEGLGRGGASDRLRDFCIEVIIPFYMNRLPEQALMINKKLGGPAHTSPPKRKAMKPPTTSRASGEPKEPDLKKSRRSLARVATETMRRSTSRATPSLSRSATDSALIKGVKREGRRELDLTTPSAAVTAKLKQKQRVEEELKDAITALKKPNRGLAAGGYVEEVERRSLGPFSRSRKQLNPVRKVVKEVQVSATPRIGRRTKDMVGQTPGYHHRISNPFARTSTSAAPPSSDFFNPSSGSRQQPMVPGTVHRSATARNLALHNVAETPSKAPTMKVFESGAARRTIFATPSKSHVAPANRSAEHVFESPVKAVGSSPPTSANFRHTTVAATPIKSFSTPVSEAQPAVTLKPVQDEERSIYASLGWDDDEDFV